MNRMAINRLERLEACHSSPENEKRKTWPEMYGEPRDENLEGIMPWDFPASKIEGNR